MIDSFQLLLDIDTANLKNSGTFMRFINKKENKLIKAALFENGRFYLDWKPSNCSSCIYDCYIQLMIKYKKGLIMGRKKQQVEELPSEEINVENGTLNEEYEYVEATLQEVELFELKSGAILMDNDSSKICTKINLTNELAKYHLEKNPLNIVKFSKAPKQYYNI